MSKRGASIAVLGGDRRMAEAVRCFLQAGCEVRVVSLPVHEQHPALRVMNNVGEALRGADLALLPVQGVSGDGKVFTQPGLPECRVDLEALRKLRAGAAVFAGIGNSWLRETCAQAAKTLEEYREADEFAIWNSIPSAEGAIGMAMEATPFTIFGSRSLVLGFGRTGKALALLLKGLYSDVTVAVRKDNDYARVWAAGYKYVGWDGLAQAVTGADIIFNTVPSMVLTREILQGALQHAVVVDVASAPGGTDFEAAKELGLTAELAPGLPGIVAPVTAGKIIAGLILRHLVKATQEEGDQ